MTCAYFNGIALREVNENYDREDRKAQIVPAITDIEIADQQPESDESDAE